MPALISLTATRRLTGSVCWAIQTRCPLPPSPIGSISLYGPITVPGLSVIGWSKVATEVGRRRPIQQAVEGRRRLRQSSQDAGDPGFVAGAPSRTYSRRRSGSGMPPGRRVKDRLKICRNGDAVIGAFAVGRVARPEYNARNRVRTHNVFTPVGQRRWPKLRSMATWREIRAYAQSCLFSPAPTSGSHRNHSAGRAAATSG